jgi:hypothetical protein
MYPFVAYSFLPYLPHGVDVVVDYAALKGAHDETIVKRCAVAGNGIIPACHLRIPCAVIHTIREKNASNDKDIILDDTHISYSQLSTVLHEAPAGYEHLIADCLRHQQMLLPLRADTPTFPQIGRFQLLTTTGPEITIILDLQTKVISVHCASCCAHS